MLNLQNFDFTNTELFNKFRNLNEFPLRVTIFRRFPTALQINELPRAFVGSYLMKDIARSNGYGGVDGIILANAAKTMNFTTMNIPQIGIDFGFKADNGTFVGMNNCNVSRCQPT